MNERLIEAGKYYGMKINIEKTKATRNSRPPT
jgi:hypothetical protein